MENNSFYKKFQKKTDSELERILNDTQLYTENAIAAAIQILKDRQVELSEEQKLTTEKLEIRKEKKRAVEEVRKKEREFPLFAKRIIAFLIDLAVLSGLSFLIGFLFVGSLLLKTTWEPLLSFTIILGYFAVLNSSIGKNILGKSVMGIKVENYDLKPLSFKVSLLRYSLLIGPYFLFTILDNFSIHSFGILAGLKYSYYIGIVYFLATDKDLRRSIHDLITRTYVTEKTQENTNFDYSKKKIKTYLFISSGIMILFISLNLLILSIAVNKIDDGKIQSEQFEVTLSESIPILERMMADISDIDGVAEVEGISLNTINNRTSLNVIIRSSSFIVTGELTNKVYERLKRKDLKINGIDNIGIIKYYGFKMTLASFNRVETKNFEQ